MQRRLDQGSQQAQGESWEVKLQADLASAFPSDTFEPTPKGIKGADLCQVVFGRTGDRAGVIVWEAKNTKAWSDGWIQKLKDDSRLLKGDVPVLVSQALPEGVTQFALVEGIWVASPAAAVPLAAALRAFLIELAAQRRASIGKSEKVELLYAYLTGNEFRQRIAAMIEAFEAMKADLDQEKRAIEKAWAKREKQLTRVGQNVAGLFGDLQGIADKALPDIEPLALPHGDLES